MDDLVTFLGTFLASFIFLGLGIGVRIYRRFPLLYGFFLTMLCGYVLVFSLDFVGMWFSLYTTFSYNIARRFLARIIICLSIWQLHWRYFQGTRQSEGIGTPC